MEPIYNGRAMPLRRFTMDDEKSFEGYDTGETWNGWACPMFTLEQAKVVAEALGGTYDEEANRFWFTFEGDERDREYFDANDGGLFAIGAWGWCWDVVDASERLVRLLVAREVRVEDASGHGWTLNPYGGGAEPPMVAWEPDDAGAPLVLATPCWEADEGIAVQVDEVDEVVVLPFTPTGDDEADVATYVEAMRAALTGGLVIRSDDAGDRLMKREDAEADVQDQLVNEIANGAVGSVLWLEGGECPMTVTVGVGREPYSLLARYEAALREMRAAIVNTPALDSSDEWTALVERIDDALGGA